MSITDELLEANRKYAQEFRLGQLAAPPSRKVAVLACMDARLHVENILGLKTGEAHIIRNAGGVATTDAIRSLLISHHLLGTQEFNIINHTDCGMLSFKEDDLRTRLEKESGTAVVEPVYFYAFPDVKENVKKQIERLQSHPWIPQSVSVRGFVYDVKTGKLEEVAGARERLKAAG